MKLETVIGLEVHAQLLTRTKAFCGCPNRYGAPPNSLVCPVCTGAPGALPVLNGKAVELALRMAVAVGATVRHQSIFARKNYFYPDNPKNYQISQFDKPLCEGGALEIEVGDQARRIRLTRIHMEEDAGKLIHPDPSEDREGSWVDFNRAGVPLIEIVSEPDLRSGEEAYAYLAALKQLLLYMKASDCNMEEGSLRCDVNVSVREFGAQQYGEKFEIKNLNSFRNVERAVACFERLAAQRHLEGEEFQRDPESRDLIHHLGRGSHTLGYDPAADRLTIMRSKEEAHDYRYFPEPDLPPLVVSEEELEAVRRALPELPWVRRERFARSFGIRPYDAAVLSATPELADYFERAAAGGADPKAVSSWIQTEVLGMLAQQKKELAGFPVGPEGISGLLLLVKDGTLSGKMAKDVFSRMVESGRSAAQIVEAEGLRQVSDPGALKGAVQVVLAQHPEVVASYLAGKDKSFTFLVGMAMKETQGRANPAMVREELTRALEALKASP